MGGGGSWFGLFCFINYPIVSGVMGCGVAEATGLVFVCFIVINPCVLSADIIDLGFFLFHNFPILLPPPSPGQKRGIRSDKRGETRARGPNKWTKPWKVPTPSGCYRGWRGDTVLLKLHTYHVYYIILLEQNEIWSGRIFSWVWGSDMGINGYIYSFCSHKKIELIMGFSTIISWLLVSPYYINLPTLIPPPPDPVTSQLGTFRYSDCWDKEGTSNVGGGGNTVTGISLDYGFPKVPNKTESR